MAALRSTMPPSERVTTTSFFGWLIWTSASEGLTYQRVDAREAHQLSHEELVDAGRVETALA